MKLISTDSEKEPNGWKQVSPLPVKLGESHRINFKALFSDQECWIENACLFKQNAMNIYDTSNCVLLLF